MKSLTRVERLEERVGRRKRVEDGSRERERAEENIRRAIRRYNSAVRMAKKETKYKYT